MAYTRPVFDPSLPGYGPDIKPPIVMVTALNQVVQYTDVSQFDFFRDWINWTGNNDCNVRLEPDGTTIRWYWAYYLPLGDYLYQGKSVLREVDLRYYFAPATTWPDDLAPLFHPQPDEPASGDETGSA